MRPIGTSPRPRCQRLSTQHRCAGWGRGNPARRLRAFAQGSSSPSDRSVQSVCLHLCSARTQRQNLGEQQPPGLLGQGGHVPPILDTFESGIEKILGQYTEGYTSRSAILRFQTQVRALWERVNSGVSDALANFWGVRERSSLSSRLAPLEALRHRR